MSKLYIANALKRLRERTGMKADDVGAIIGKSGKTVNAWENGRGQPDAEMLIKLSSIYNVDNLLAEFDEDRELSTTNKFTLSEKETELIISYRKHPEHQSTIDKILDIETKTTELHIAASNGANATVKVDNADELSKDTEALRRKNGFL